MKRSFKDSTVWSNAVFLIPSVYFEALGYVWFGLLWFFLAIGSSAHHYNPTRESWRLVDEQGMYGVLGYLLIGPYTLILMASAFFLPSFYVIGILLALIVAFNLNALSILAIAVLAVAFVFQRYDNHNHETHYDYGVLHAVWHGIAALGLTLLSISVLS